jgi:hypothetical protein
MVGSVPVDQGIVDELTAEVVARANGLLRWLEKWNVREKMIRQRVTIQAIERNGIERVNGNRTGNRPACYTNCGR